MGANQPGKSGESDAWTARDINSRIHKRLTSPRINCISFMRIRISNLLLLLLLSSSSLSLILLLLLFSSLSVPLPSWLTYSYYPFYLSRGRKRRRTNNYCHYFVTPSTATSSFSCALPLHDVFSVRHRFFTNGYCEYSQKKKKRTRGFSSTSSSFFLHFLCAVANKKRRNMDVAGDDATMVDASKKEEGNHHSSHSSSSEVFNYVVTAHKPTAVSYSCVGRFVPDLRQELSSCTIQPN